ncbi:hypothetical protein [Halococcoides cellulosivorans]|uniref:Uncharacterized protein n=1 Tax=Halococcoides cellulosivorans TaxID=1679096 RepID=A0A2R4X1E8_9EURY|nr:hypothetical protein [Halococcoides cellulosivorans]AWB27553.1 hypothetical protein HARCEL1_07440 [Halococcoides cellulosivorans]
MGRLSTVLSRLVEDGAAGALAGERRTAASLADLEARLDDPPAAFADEREVRAVLAERCPPLDEPPRDLLGDALSGDALDRYLETWQPGHSAIRPNEVFLHPEFVPPDRARSYDALAELGVDLLADREATLEVRNGLAFLTEAAVERVREAIATEIGQPRKDALQRVASGGVPEPVVEDIDLDVKVAFDDQLDASVIDAAAPPAGLNGDAVGELSTSMHFK